MPESSTFDWNDLFTLISLVTTTLGGVLLAYIALQQKRAANQVELARIESAKQARQLRRIKKQAKTLDTKTDQQTKMIDDTCRAVDEVKKQTNGLTERLVAAEAHKARHEGRAEGAAEATKTAEVVANRAKEAVKEAIFEVAIPPTQILVTPTNVEADP